MKTDIFFSKMESAYPRGWAATQPSDPQKSNLFMREWKIRLEKVDDRVLSKAVVEWIDNNEHPPKINQFMDLCAKVRTRSGIQPREDNQLKSEFERVRKRCDEQYAKMLASGAPVSEIQRYRRVMAYNELAYTRGMRKFVTPEDPCGIRACNEKISRINREGMWVCDNEVN